MNQIEPNNLKSFFLGILTLILHFKIENYEKDYSPIEEIKSDLNLANNHINLLKDLSTIAYFELTLLSCLFNFSGSLQINNQLFANLLTAFKYFKTYRRFRKR